MTRPYILDIDNETEVELVTAQLRNNFFEMSGSSDVFRLNKPMDLKFKDQTGVDGIGRQVTFSGLCLYNFRLTNEIKRSSEWLRMAEGFDGSVFENHSADVGGVWFKAGAEGPLPLPGSLVRLIQEVSNNDDTVGVECDVMAKYQVEDGPEGWVWTDPGWGVKP